MNASFVIYKPTHGAFLTMPITSKTDYPGYARVQEIHSLYDDTRVLFTAYRKANIFILNQVDVCNIGDVHAKSKRHLCEYLGSTGLQNILN